MENTPVALVITVVSIRFYRKYQREKKKEDQQELIKAVRETNKNLQNREKSNGKIHRKDNKIP